MQSFSSYETLWCQWPSALRTRPVSLRSKIVSTLDRSISDSCHQGSLRSCTGQRQSAEVFRTLVEQRSSGRVGYLEAIPLLSMLYRDILPYPSLVLSFTSSSTSPATLLAHFPRTTGIFSIGLHHVCIPRAQNISSPPRSPREKLTLCRILRVSLSGWLGAVMIERP